MAETQIFDSGSLPRQMTLDATDTPRDRRLSGGLPLLQPEIIPTGYSGEQTESYYTNGDSSAAQLKLNDLLFTVPPESEIKEFFRAIQKWEGFVLDVGSDTFRARLVSIVGEGPDQEAEIYLEEVDPDDRPLLQPGAVFYWTIGYLDRPSGRLRAAILRFRRLPAWSETELNAARNEAKKLASLFE